MGALHTIKRLEAEIAALRGVIASQQLAAIERAPAWAAPLTRQQAALVGILYGAHPRILDRYEIEMALPSHDHARDRDVRIVQIVVCHVRRKLGRDAIENVHGCGYRLGDAFAARVRGERRASGQPHPTPPYPFASP